MADIIIECGAPVNLAFHRGTADNVNGLGEYSRVIIRDVATGKEVEVFRGTEFSEKDYLARVESTPGSLRKTRQPPV